MVRLIKNINNKKLNITSHIHVHPLVNKWRNVNGYFCTHCGSEVCVFLPFACSLTWACLCEHSTLNGIQYVEAKAQTLPQRSKHGSFSEHSVPLHLVKQHLRAVFIFSRRVFPPFMKLFISLCRSLLLCLSFPVWSHTGSIFQPRWELLEPASLTVLSSTHDP